jgi:hypothetical protein
MINKCSADQATQPIKVMSVKKETPEERMQRLKATADATGRRFIHVYLEDERQRHKQGHC